MNKLFGAILLLSLVGCSSVGHLKTNDSKRSYKPTVGSKVKLFSKADAKRKYDVLGVVVASADAGDSAERPIKLLKEEAAKLGADRIMNTQIQLSYGFWTSGIEATGVAVKMRGRK